MTDELGDLEATIVTSSINFYGENNIIDIQGSHQQNIARGTTDPEIESVHLSNLLNNCIS